ncbi:hypothetical protein BGX23_007156 [Mortierella sp. AD031]|nr:hypothetical protein BGX23_007156 [Mortierella sp. AD031]
MFSLLPLECFQLILQSLAETHGFAALATLLRVNKYIANLTLPYLYSNPYRRQTGFVSNSLRTLSRTLLDQANLTYIPEIITLAFKAKPRRQSRPAPPLDYLVHIRHLDLEPCIVIGNRSWGDWVLKTKEMAYIETEDFKAICRLDRLLPSFANGNGELMYNNYWNILKRRTTWALASTVPEQLKSLVLPISDIDRYLGLVDRLTNLEHLRFNLDEIFDYDDSDYDLPPTFLEATAIRKEVTMRAMVHFIEEHGRLFKGRLKTATCLCELMSPPSPQFCPEEIQLNLIRALPPLQKPTYLNRVNWRQFLAHPESTDLGHVKEITTWNTPKFCLDRILDSQQFLQRCRSLRRINMESLGQGCFDWAAQEKRSLDSISNSTTLDNQPRSGQVLPAKRGSQPAYLRYGLVPVEQVRIKEHRTLFTDEIDDIAFAFSHTLMELKAEASYNLSRLCPWQSIHIGRGWVHLPALTSLELSGWDRRLVIAEDMLTLCPNIVKVHLFDKTMEYKYDDITPWKSAHLARLEDLNLKGWSALSFHPTTLHSTSRLLSLSLRMEDDTEERHYIPPVQELDRSYIVQDTGFTDEEAAQMQSPYQVIRPHWSWDWDLPQLRELRLSAEFAYRFEFRMLLGCPWLEDLSLDITAVGDGHERVISASDLFIPDTAGGTSVTSQEQQRIVLPWCHSLKMKGMWVFDKAILRQFLSGMFPSLENLSEMRWGGVSLGDVLEVVREMRSLKEVELEFPAPTRDERVQLRLFCAYDYAMRKNTLPVGIRIQGRKYVMV